MITCNVCGQAPQSLGEGWVKTYSDHYHRKCAVLDNKEYSDEVETWFDDNARDLDGERDLEDFLWNVQRDVVLKLDDLDPNRGECQHIMKEDVGDR